jgi:enoyl-CoA hydratase/carnithine racemase
VPPFGFAKIQRYIRPPVGVETVPPIRDHFAMHPDLGITTHRGTATLWLAFPGEPVNALDLSRLKQLNAAFAELAANAFIDRVVIRSAKPAGFCAGLHPDAVRSLQHPSDRAAFSRFGQGVMSRLANLPQATIAFIEGPCLGAGFELALACDHRLCVAGLANHLGFPFERPCFGGSARVPKSLVESRRTLSGREARDLGLVDRAFCERRAKLELQMFLDELEKHPRVPNRTRPTSLAAEAQAFVQDMGRERGTIPPLEPGIALARGFITPLEFDQLAKREQSSRETASFLKAAA